MALDMKYRVVLSVILITIIILVSLFVLKILPTNQTDNPSDNSDKTLTEIAQILSDSQIMKVQVQDDVAYVIAVGNNPLGLVAIDIADPKNPSVLGSFLSGWPLQVSIVNDIAYTAGIGGLSIIDISDPGNMSLLGNYRSNFTIIDLFIIGDLAYVTVEGIGLEIVNISNPTSLELISSTIMNSPIRLEVIGDTCFVSKVSNIEAYDISNPVTPQYLGEYHLGQAIFFDLQANSHYLYASDHSSAGEWFILDIQDPSSITLISKYSTGGTPLESWVEGDIAYVTDYEKGLLLLDISNPSMPEVLVSHFDGGAGQDVEVVGEYIFFADRTDGLEILQYK